MTAAVVDLATARHRRQRASSDCPCTDEITCYPHRVADAVTALDGLLADTDQELLVSRADLEATFGTVLPALRAIVRECLGPTERQAR